MQKNKNMFNGNQYLTDAKLLEEIQISEAAKRSNVC